MSSFDLLCRRLARRQRLVHGLSAAGWTLLATLGLTAIALMLRLNLVPAISPFWVFVGNITLASLAFAWGWLRPITMTEVLFRADRNAHSEEKLVTFYELLMGQGPKEFLPLLARRLEDLALQSATALPIEQKERRLGLGVLALALVCAGFGVTSEVWNPSESPGRESVQTHQQAVRIADLVQPPPATVAQKLPTLRERLEQARAALAQNPSDPRARAILQQLQEEIRQEQDRLVNPPPQRSSFPSRNDASLAENSPGDVRSRAESAQEQTALDRLIQALRAIHGHAHELSPEEMQKLFEQLQEENPEAASIAQQAWHTAQNDQEFREKLEEALKNLEARRALHQELEQLKREAHSALAQGELPQTAARPDTQPPESPEGSQPSPSSSQSSQSSGAETEPQEGPRQEKPSGGRGKAPLDPQAVKDLPDLSQLRERTRSFSVPAAHQENLEILFEIISTGLPHNPDTAGQPTAPELDYQKVEALIDALEIPVELRPAVRQYFLSLAKDYDH
jgi:hypothetical protein